ncbi:MAG TPA: hypothetical protein VGF39_09405 [Stellaceae bacterium]
MAGVFFAVAMIDASVIGAMAVSLFTAYAIGDVRSLRHSVGVEGSKGVGLPTRTAFVTQYHPACRLSARRTAST